MSNKRQSSVVSPHGDQTSQVSREVYPSASGFEHQLNTNIAVSPPGSQVGIKKPMRMNSLENLASPTRIVNPESTDIFTTNMQSHRNLLRD